MTTPDEPGPERLSQIQTLWSVIRVAHDSDGASPEVRAAKEALLAQYGGAIRRYLLAALRSEDAADEVYQDFALKFLRGAFHGANPDRGRFRSFVKTIIYRMIVDYQRLQKRLRAADVHELDAADHRGPLPPEEESAFQRSWRDDLLARTWEQLQADEERTGRPYFTLMQLRTEFPEARSDDLAIRLAERLGTPQTAGAVRVALHRARERFAELLLTAIMQALGETTAEAVEAELHDLDLMKYTKEAFEKRFRSGN
jgi:RNA polymerase sigma factor (sigma-70 family)